MKRLAATLICGLGVMLVWASAASASTAPRHIDFLRLQHRVASQPAGSFAQAGAQTYRLSGTAEEYDGTLLDDAGIGWGWYDPDAASWSPVSSVYHYGGWASTDSKGRFSVNVTAHPGHDEIEADGPFRADIMNNPTPTDPGLMNICRWGLDFSSLGSITLRPGRVQVDVANVPAHKYLLVTLGDPATGLADSVIAPGGLGLADCPPPGFTSAVAQGAPSDSNSTKVACEWISPDDTPVTASAGALTAGTVTMDWNTAVHGHLAGPRCQLACRRGGVVRYAISHVPVGEQFSFAGYCAYSGGATAYGPVVSSASVGATYTVSLRVPSRAPVAEPYTIEAYRSDDPYSDLQLSDDVEVCRFWPSTSTVTRGNAVTLRGRIDAQSATLFASRPGTPRPTTIGAPGWTRVASLHLSTRGDFSVAVRPTRATRYVVRFTNYAYQRFFTPLVTVRVR
jgi:hypothetical protein